jgi:hypothetical protein
MAMNRNKRYFVACLSIVYAPTIMQQDQSDIRDKLTFN